MQRMKTFFLSSVYEMIHSALEPEFYCSCDELQVNYYKIIVSCTYMYTEQMSGRGIILHFYDCMNLWRGNYM